MASFSVLVPTIARPTLIQTVCSFLANKSDGDRMLVLADIHDDPDNDVFNRALRTVARAIECRPSSGAINVAVAGYDAGYHHLGVEQMNWAWRVNRCDCRNASHLMIIGDDDVYLDGAFDILRYMCDANPDRPVIFQFVAPWRAVLPAKFEIVKSKISGCCIAVPMKYMRPHPTERVVEHDFYWIESVVDAARQDGHEPVWLERVLVVARPDSYTVSTSK